MRIASFGSEDGNRIGIETDHGLIDYTSIRRRMSAGSGKDEPPVRDIMQLFGEGRFRAEEFRRAVEYAERSGILASAVAPADARRLAPVTSPGKILAVGRNYRAHSEESNLDVPREPIVFQKANSSIIGPGDAVLIPPEVGRVDYEIEVVLFIGKRASRVSARNALDHVGGYTILNDVTARKMQMDDAAVQNPWFRSKSFDTFAPIGPCILTADEVTHPLELDLEMKVNGETRQKSNTRMLLFQVPVLIEFISRHITLFPGDIISTGTPAGIGPIKPGDEMVGTVEKIGRLVNPVRLRE